MSRIYEHLIAKLHQLAVQTVIKSACQLLWRVCFGKIRPANVADKQGVASQNRPWLRRFFLISNHQTSAFRSMSWGFQSRNAQLAESHFRSIMQGHMRKRGAGLYAN